MRSWTFPSDQNFPLINGATERSWLAILEPRAKNIVLYPLRPHQAVDTVADIDAHKHRIARAAALTVGHAKVTDDQLLKFVEATKHVLSANARRLISTDRFCETVPCWQPKFYCWHGRRDFGGDRRLL